MSKNMYNLGDIVRIEDEHKETWFLTYIPSYDDDFVITDTIYSDGKVLYEIHPVNNREKSLVILEEWIYRHKDSKFMNKFSGEKHE